MNTKDRAAETARQVERYAEGASIKGIAKEFGMSQAGVRRRLLSWGVKLRGQGSRGKAHDG